jgi:hypothetical protein
VTQWQVNDNLTWTRGQAHVALRHQYAPSRRERLRPGRGHGADGYYNDLAEFTYGAAYRAANFPVSLNESVASGNLEYYAMDTYKPTTKTTVTYGMRVTWNTNPLNQQQAFFPHGRLVPRCSRTCRISR